MYAKKQWFTNENKFNSVFIGTSLTQSQIIPEIIDSLCSSYNLKSFNLGVPSTRPPESFYLAENLIQSHENLNTIFIELLTFKSSLPEDIIAEEFYYFNLKTLYVYTIHNYTLFIISKNIARFLKYSVLSIKYFFYNVSNLDYLSHIFIYKSEKELKNLLLETQNGFTKSGFRGHKIIPVEDLPFNDEIFKKRAKGYIKSEKTALNTLNKSQVLYMKWVEKINRMCDNKDIKIVWYLPPCLGIPDYSYILPIYNRIETNKKINLADPKKYENFYTAELHRDKAHFNYNGAVLYSNSIANEVIQIWKELN
jgi:hypothetical protein